LETLEGQGGAASALVGGAGHAARLAGNPDLERAALAKAIDLTEDRAVRRWLEGVTLKVGS
ncbi:MAG: hypothetical protein HC783_02015, partial [Rhodobacteraceae bacterium]|nr:hypothetical protein [Paracoccaceae bacterium]